jgi:DNA sulfur modification protein DndB
MLRIQDNFTDSITLLRSEKKRRANSNSLPDEIFENQLWLFLYKLGFTTLNIGRECKVQFGKSVSCLVSKKDDIIAESKEARLYVECSTQASVTPKIKQWIADVSLIRKYEKIEKNFAFIYYTDKSPSNADRDKLKSAGIQLVTQKTKEYIEDLVQLYKNLAYYQFLGFIFSGKEIRYFSKEEFKVPAIRAKYTSKQKCYLFGIHPSKLIPLASVLHRKMDIEDSISGNYQRLVKKQKISSIKKFIKEQGGVFPTNIIISFDNKKSYFHPKGAKLNDIEFGDFELPREFHSITIIDGQHRLFAYDGLEEANNHLIYVIAFEKMPIDQQIKTFVDINEKQTKVSPRIYIQVFWMILILGLKFHK